jgi:hypothetical protein
LAGNPEQILISACPYLSTRGRLAGLPDRRSANRPRGRALPVRRIFSGRDQASATPSIAISHPLTGAMPGGVQYEHGNYMIPI